MIEDLIKRKDFINEINDLLEYEKLIELKKKNNMKLTKEEYIFDTYFIKPSTLIKFILHDAKKQKDLSE